MQRSQYFNIFAECCDPNIIHLDPVKETIGKAILYMCGKVAIGTFWFFFCRVIVELPHIYASLIFSIYSKTTTTKALRDYSYRFIVPWISEPPYSNANTPTRFIGISIWPRFID